jgi:hypothetical protein
MHRSAAVTRGCSEPNPVGRGKFGAGAGHGDDVTAFVQVGIRYSFVRIEVASPFRWSLLVQQCRSLSRPNSNAYLVDVHGDRGLGVAELVGDLASGEAGFVEFGGDHLP